MKKIIYFVLFVMISLVAYADIYAQGSTIDLQNVCTDDGALCSGGSCNKTVIYPNSSLMVSNQAMTGTGSVFNYTLPNSLVLGEYTEITSCCVGTNCETEENTFQITYGGYEDFNSRDIIIAAGFMAVILLALALFITDERLYVFKITFALLATFIVLLVIPSALLSERVALTLFKWGGIMSYLIGVLILIFISISLWDIAVNRLFGAKK